MHAFCTQAISSSFLNPLPVPIHPSLNLWQRRQEWRRAYLRGDEARIQNLHSVSSLTVSVALGRSQSLLKPHCFSSGKMGAPVTGLI